LKKHIDDVDVSWFKISSIQKGQLFNYDQSLEILSESYISYSQSQEGLMFCPAPDSVETGFFDVESSENGIHVSPQSDRARINITVIPVDDAPFVTSPLGTKTANEDDPPTLIDLKTVFHDIDNAPDEIRYSIHENTNRTLVKVSITETTLQLSYQPDQSGDARITILALSNGKTEMDNLNIQVLSIDDPPIIKQALADIQTIEDSYGKSIDLTHVFTDIDNDDALIVKSIHSNSNTDLVQASIQRNTLFLSFLPEQHGTATVMIKGQSNGKEVLASITILVESQDDPPYIAQQLEDIQTHEDAGDITIPLISVFSDKDNDDSTIRLILYFQSHPDICTASIENNHLMVSFISEQNGVCQMIIQAESQGLTAHMNMNLNVTAIDDPPVVKNPISMITVQEDDPDYVIDLSQVFTDIDNDDAAMVISVFNNTNSDLVEASVKSEQNTVLSLSESSEPWALASGIASEPRASASDIASEPRALASGIASEPRTLASGIASEPRALASDIASEPRTLASDIASEPRALASDIASEPRALASGIASEPRALASGIASEPCALASDIASEPRALASDIFLSDVCSMPLANARGSDSFVRGSDAMPLADARGSDAISLADARGSDAISLADARGSDAISLADARGSDAISLANARGSDSKLLNLHFLPNQNGIATITLKAQSGAQYVTHSFAITVIPVDDAPIILQSIEDIIVDEDAPTTQIDLIPIFSDIDNDDNAIIKQISDNSNTALITPKIIENQLFIAYKANQSGDATLILSAQSNGKTITTSAKIHVNAINDAPIAKNSSLVIKEDQTITGKLSAQDIENDQIYYMLSKAATGYVDINNFITGEFTYTPQKNYYGDDSFMFFATDGELKSYSATVSITIQPINDAPETGSFALESFENTELFFSFANFNSVFTDIDGDQLKKIRITQLPQKGTLLLNNSEIASNSSVFAEHLSQFSFIPDLDWAGTTSFTYKASDDLAWSAEAGQVTITVIAYPPGTAMVIKSGTEDQQVTFSATDLKDFRLNSTSWLKLTALPEHGILLFDPVMPDDTHTFEGVLLNEGDEVKYLDFIAGQLVYIPEPNFYGLDVYKWKASKNDIWSDDALVKLNIMPVNDPPTIHSIEINAVEDAIIEFNRSDFISSYTDIENDTLSKLQFISLPDSAMGQLRLNDQDVTMGQDLDALLLDQLTFYPMANISGTAICLFKVSDAKNWSLPSNLTMHLAPVGDTPVVKGLDIIEDSPSEPIIIQKHPQDGDEVTAFLIDHINGGQLYLVSNNTPIANQSFISTAQGLSGLTFIPTENNTNECGFDVWSSEDGQTIAAQSDAAHVTITIMPVDDPPFIANGLPDFSLKEDNPIVTRDLNQVFFDVDNDQSSMQFIVASLSNPALLTATIVNHTLNIKLYANQLGASDIVIAAISNGKTVQTGCHITVSSLQDAPVTENMSIQTFENMPISNTVIAYDADHDKLSYHLVEPVQKGLLSLNSETGEFTYTPTQYENGSDAFRFNVFDGVDDSNSSVVSIWITPVNNPPTISDFQKTGNEDTKLFFNTSYFSSVFSDPDHDQLECIRVIQLPENGQLLINDVPIEINERIIATTISQMNFMPAQNWYGTTSFIWVASDGALISENQATVTITITDIPDNIDMIVKSGLEDTDIIFTDEDLAPFNIEGLIYVKAVTLPQSGVLLYDQDAPSPDHEFTPIQLSEGQELHISVFMTGVMLYRPEPDFNGSVSFLWRANTSGVWTEDGMVKITIFPVNDPPVIADLSVSGKEDTVITFNKTDFVSVFSDIDGDLLNQIKITDLPASSLGTLYKNNTPLQVNTDIPKKDIASLTFKPNKDQFGQGKFLWKAFDGESWSKTSQKYDINILPVADTPMSQTYETLEDTATEPIYLTKHINDGDEVLYFKISNILNGQLFMADSDQEIVNASFISVKNSQKGLVFKPLSNVTSHCGFNVDASENGMTVSEQSNRAYIDIHIIPVDDPPEILSEIQNIHAQEDDSPILVDISNAFTDPDSLDDQISIQVINIDNPQLFEINQKDYRLTIQFKDNQHGQGQFTVMGISNGLTVSRQVSVQVAPVDDPPCVSNPIENLSLNEDVAPFDIDLSTVFNDIDSEDLKLFIADNSNPQLLSVVMSNEKLLIKAFNNQNGSTNITIIAEADNQQISETFSIDIAAVDDPPSVLNPPDALTVFEDDSTIPLDLSSTFTDIDNDDSNIKISVLTVSQPGFLSATIMDKQLQIHLTNDQFGQTTLILQAESNNQTITQAIDITVLSVDDPPEINSPVADIIVQEDASAITTNISAVFMDKDSDNAAIEILLLNNTNELLCDARVLGQTLVIQLIDNQYGASQITLMARSDGLFVTHAFQLKVNPVNDAPVLNSIYPELENITEDDINNSGQPVSDLVNSAVSDIDLNPVKGMAIIGQNSGNGQWQYQLTSNDEWQSIETLSIENALLLKATDRIRFLPNEKQGSLANLTYVAWDQTSGMAGQLTHVSERGGQSAFSDDSDTCLITVSDINDLPIVATNKTLYIYEGSSIALTSGILHITDVDNSPDEITLYSDEPRTKGDIFVGQKILLPGETITQKAINDGLISYHHYGSESDIQNYIFQISDGWNTVQNVSFYIQVIPVNDPPVIVNNRPLGLGEGDTQLIVSSFLKTTDNDNLPEHIIYTLTDIPVHGTLFNADMPVSVSQTFTQKDIQDERIAYQHNGSEYHTDGFHFCVSDGLILIESHFAIVIQEHNDPPQLIVNRGLILNEGDSHDITPVHIWLTDSDNAPNEIILEIIEAPQNGQLQMNDVSVNQFSIADIDLQRVSYVHNSSESRLDSILFNIYDQSGGTVGEIRFNITILPMNDLPGLLINKGLTINEGQKQIINSGLLFAGDMESIFASQLHYIIQEFPEHGALFLNNTPIIANESFTQDDIDHERIAYLHDGSESSNDSFLFIVQDADGGQLTQTAFQIQVNAVNDAPQLEDQQIWINENPDMGTVIRLNPAIDTDIPKQSLKWSIIDGNSFDIFTIHETNGQLVIQKPEQIDYENVPNHAFILKIMVTDNGYHPINLSDTAQMTIAITDINEAPLISNVSDVSTHENKPTPVQTFTFSDPESNTSDLNLTVRSSNTQLVPHQNVIIEQGIVDNRLYIIPVAQQFGTSEIALTVHDPQNLSTTERFVVTVNEIDDPPVVQQSIPILSVYEDSSDRHIDLSKIFTDPDNNDADIIKTISANDQPEMITATIDHNTLHIHLNDNQNGEATIAITGISNGQSVSTYFMITVIPVDDPPFIAQTIPTIELNEDCADFVMDLSSLFSDMDNDDASIIKSLISNDSNERIQAAINDNDLSIQCLPDQFGTSHLTIGAESNGKTIQEKIQVNIAPVDDPPAIATGLNDIFVLEDAQKVQIDLSPVFTDKDSDINQMTYHIFANDHPDMIMPQIEANQLQIAFQPNQNGRVALTVMAESNGLTVIDDCQIDIAPVDDPPYLASVLDRLDLIEDQKDAILDISDWFADMDNNANMISKSIIKNTLPDVLEATISGNILTIMVLPDAYGSGSITILGVSNGQSVQHVLTIDVQSQDDPPVVVHPIDNIYTNEDAGIQIIDISQTFDDIDDPSHIITVEIIKNTNPILLNAVMMQSSIQISLQENQSGQADLTLKAKSNDQSVTTTVHIEVEAVNDPPIAINQSFVVSEDQPVSEYFTANDPDHTKLIYQIHSFPQHGMFEYTPDGSFTYHPEPDFSGKDTVLFVARDEHLQSSPGTIEFIISPLNDPPTVEDILLGGYENTATLLPKPF
jgi:hypothetical protein